MREVFLCDIFTHAHKLLSFRWHIMRLCIRLNLLPIVLLQGREFFEFIKLLLIGYRLGLLGLRFCQAAAARCLSAGQAALE